MERRSRAASRQGELVRRGAQPRAANHPAKGSGKQRLGRPLGIGAATLGGALNSFRRRHLVMPRSTTGRVTVESPDNCANGGTRH